MCCHPERGEGALSMGSEMLRCAQHDNAGFGPPLRQGSNECDTYDTKQPKPAPVGDRHEAQADELPLAGDSPRPQANRW
jgi:hypothetical protein